MSFIKDDYGKFLANSFKTSMRTPNCKCRICGGVFFHIDQAVNHEQEFHPVEIREYERRAEMAKKPCDHLNVESQSFSGVQMAVCKDCGKNVNPDQFEKIEVKNTVMPIPPAAEGEKPVDTMKRVQETIVSGMVEIPGLEKPFFPLFGVKKGDVVIVLRQKGP